jgi:hypothetical protein
VSSGHGRTPELTALYPHTRVVTVLLTSQLESTMDEIGIQIQKEASCPDIMDVELDVIMIIVSPGTDVRICRNREESSL